MDKTLKCYFFREEDQIQFIDPYSAQCKIFRYLYHWIPKLGYQKIQQGSLFDQILTWFSYLIYIKKCLSYQIWIYIKYGILFWEGGLKDTDIVFKVQKKCLRVIKGVNNRVSCRRMLGEFKILTVTSLYTFEILRF
jgi:hypothetical protein